jgi:hypothetical protein
MHRSEIKWEQLRGNPLLFSLRELDVKVRELAISSGIDGSRFTALSDLDWVDRALNRVSATFSLIVIGQVSSGKSSFINSLLGRKLLLPSDSPTDGVVSILLASDKNTEYAEKVLHDGSVEPFSSLKEATLFLRQQETPAVQQLRCKEVRLYLNEPWLRHLRIINTPGLGDRLQEFEKTALQYFHEDESDLVVWTFFPDSAANRDEIGVFADTLARRRGSVLGVVTRCIEGNEDDINYDPREDPAFVDETKGVVPFLRKKLGTYLSDIILYDSHYARRLVQQMREQPDLQADPAFVRNLDRSGYSHFQRTLTSLLGGECEKIQEAKIASFLNRCKGHSLEMANAAEAAEKAFMRQANVEKEQVIAWQKVEKEIIGPARNIFKDEVRTLAEERAKELVLLMGNSTAEAIKGNFKLLETLGRSLSAWTGLCDPAADALNKKIENAVDESIRKAQFNERLRSAMEILTKERLEALVSDLCSALEMGNSKISLEIPVDPGKPASGAGEIPAEALSGALKGVISAVLKAFANQLEAKAAAEAAKEGAKQLTKQAAKKAAEEAAKHAAKQGAGAAAARIASIITLVLIPFDVTKLLTDFKKGRDNLAEAARVRYQADRPSYDARIFDSLWRIADETLAGLLKGGRANLDARNEAQTCLLSEAQNAASCRASLSELADRFQESIHG